MTRSSLRRAQRDLYLAQRTLRDVDVLTGKNGVQRYAKRRLRRWAVAAIFHRLPK